MLLNYLKLSLRLLARNPFFTLINVLGLSVGFAAFFILWQHVSAELKTDQYHKDFERIGRIGAHWRWIEEGKEGHLTWGNILAYQFPKILADFPEIEDHTRFVGESGWLMSTENTKGEKKEFVERDVIRAEPNLFDFFTIPLIYGDKSTVLSKANAVVLSQSTAIKYFGNENPIDQLMTLDDSITVVVTGVFQDLPGSTHLRFDAVLSNVGKEREWDEKVVFWAWCYVKLRDPGEFEKLTHDLNLNKQEYWEAVLKMYKESSGEMFVQPLVEIAFNNFPGDWFEPKSRFSLFILGIVSVLILVVAWINYMNLTVSRTMKRLKEIATRKVSGAIPLDFMKQFLVESSVINVLAVALAFTGIQLLRQPVELFFQISIIDFDSAPAEIWLTVLLSIATGVGLTSLYPAYMSISYNPWSLLAISGKAGMRSLFPSVLTTVQYTTAFVLIGWIFIVYSQLNFILHKDLGINKNNVVVIDAPIVKTPTYDVDINSFITKIAMTHSVTHSHSVFRDNIADQFRIRRPGHDMVVLPSNGGIDETFIPFYGIKLLAGRNFVPGDQSHGIIVSRFGIERMGYEKMSDALGDRVQVMQGITKPNDISAEMEIIGIIEDYSMRPFFNNSENDTNVNGNGICLVFKNAVFSYMTTERISVRMDMVDFEKQIGDIEDEYKRIFPGSFLNWYFLEDRISRDYDQEKISGNQIALFASLAIGISCLGLLGMISNRVNEKTKEIGIRKILGAGLRQISMVLLQSTIVQLFVASLLGMPIAYYLGQQYLDHYTAQISLQWWHFGAPIIILLMIMSATISSVLLKAASSNPVEALKHE